MSHVSHERLLAYRAELDDVIAREGWAVQGVFPCTGQDGACFSYTIGMHAAGLPELLISGGTFPDMNMLLNIAAKDHLRNEFTPGVLYVNKYFRFPMMPIKAPAAEIGWAKSVYGPTVKAIQLIWPDNKGLWPGQPGFNRKKQQDLFGTFTIP